MKDSSTTKKSERRGIKQRLDFRRIAKAAVRMVKFSAVVAVFGTAWVFIVFDSPCGGKEKRAEVEIKQLNNLVEAYYLSVSPRAFPDHLEELTKGRSPLTKEIPKDPWGADYVYRKVSDREFSITSPGPDGIECTEDDIGVEADHNHYTTAPRIQEIWTSAS